MAVQSVPGQWSYAPLTPEEVRWFWTKPSLSLKAVYQLDVPHRAHLLRYCDKDNIRLERAYRCLGATADDKYLMDIFERCCCLHGTASGR